MRLLRSEPFVDDAARQAMTIASELVWDDMLDCVEADTVTDALLGLLPRPMPRPRRRRLATLAGHVHNRGVEARPARSPPPATMAEQLCVGALTHYAQTAVVDLARDGAVTRDRPHEDDSVDLTLWTDLYLADVDHELPYDPALDGIDDDTTDRQDGFGRMGYEACSRSSTNTTTPTPACRIRWRRCA